MSRKDYKGKHPAVPESQEENEPAQLIDAVREFWDAQPCNIRHSPAEVGTREYFDQVTERKYFVEPHIPCFAEFDRWAGKKVLEIGCGIGTDAANFALAEAEYTGVELSERSLALARRRFQLFGLKGRFFCGNAEDLASIVPPEQYDLVYSFGVLHHTPHPETVISGIRARYMGRHSEFRLMLYAHDSWKRVMIDAGLDWPEACPIARTYTREQARKLLQDFRSVEIEQDHIFPYEVQPYRNYRYEREPWFACMLPRRFRALERAFGRHLLIRCKF